MKFCLLILVFQLFIKQLNALSLPTIITDNTNLVSTNQCCLFNQSRDVYDSDTAVLHWFISKSDKVNVLFSLNPFPSAFQGLFSTFILFFVIFQNYRLMKTRSTDSNDKIRVPVNIKDGIFLS